METAYKAQTWAITLLLLSCTSLTIAMTVFVAKHSCGAELINKARALQMTADAYRAASLAKTYDVKAAAMAMRELSAGLRDI